MVLNNLNRLPTRVLKKAKSKVGKEDRGKENIPISENDISADVRTDTNNQGILLQKNTRVKQIKKRKISERAENNKKRKISQSIPFAKQAKTEASPETGCQEVEESIEQISQRLKENMARAKYRLLESLIHSNKPHDLLIYEKVFTHPYSIKVPDKPVSATIEDKPCDVPLLQISTSDITKNLSFNSEQENDFITTWLQYPAAQSQPHLQTQDSFSIVTDQELSALLGSDDFSFDLNSQ